MTTRLACGFLVVALARADAAVAQLTRDPRGATVGTATLSGIVVSDDLDARPVRRARVTCAAPELREGLTAITDDGGRFTCARLPAGRYTVQAARDGWVATSYGAKRPLRPGVPVPLAAGQHAAIVVRLTRGAAITGALLDESGQPAAGASVVALRTAMQNGERRLVDFGTPSMTDDRGVYRIYGLPPGDYVVRATPSTASLLQDVLSTTDLDLQHARATTVPVPPDRRVTFAATYYPGTPLVLQSSRVTVRAGEERSDIDFALQLVSTARIEGIVTMPDGTPASGSTQITLMPSGSSRLDDSPLEGVKTTRAGSDGSFAFAGIPPGLYSLLARAATPAVVWAAMDVAVDGERLSGLNLTMQSGLTIAGAVRIDGSAVSVPFDTTAIRVAAESVQPAGDVTLAPSSTAVDRAGRFAIAGVTPGRYRLTVVLPSTARARGWSVASALVNGTDALDSPFAVAPGAPAADVAVTLTSQSAEVSGALLDASGAPVSQYTVILFPTDSALWLPRARRIQAGRAGTDGAFAFHTLAPGEYLLSAIDDAEAGEWFDPAFLQRLAPGAIRLTVAPGERKTQDLRVGPGSNH